ncbi:hypothetical protein DMA11_12185 [Marinilabiliaceae bacterium JC017]|nr:hypothetical protein DMA11_12185 [Marinilabiliaceae bacterium JC017]
MPSKPITQAFARCLMRMLTGEMLNYSDFSSKALLRQFVEDGIILRMPAGSRRFNYRCVAEEELAAYLNRQFDIHSLKEYINSFNETAIDGQASLQATTSTKTFRKHSLQGFFIKPFNTSITLSNKPVPELPPGAELFVHQPELLTLSPSALVIGVENPECFIKFHKLLHLFPQQEILVVMRYLSISPNKWLATIPNQYLHFGDFDPAGIAIYFNEYLSKLGAHRCRFLVPNNIDDLIHIFGNADLFNKQKHQLPDSSNFNQPELLELINTIKKYGKGLEQERMIGK